MQELHTLSGIGQFCFGAPDLFGGKRCFDNRTLGLAVQFILCGEKTLCEAHACQIILNVDTVGIEEEVIDPADGAVGFSGNDMFSVFVVDGFFQPVADKGLRLRIASQRWIKNHSA